MIETADMLRRKQRLDECADNPHKNILEQVPYERWTVDAIELLLEKVLVLECMLERLVPGAEVTKFPEDEAR